MILLMGGTAETSALATAIAEAGFEVLVSTATEVPLDVGKHPNISRRSGPLDRAGMVGLAINEGIRLIVDASHPYASSASANAGEAASELGIPHLRWLRPPVLEASDRLIIRETHDLAAEAACSFGVPVLLTTGSRNLVPYVTAADRAGVTLIVRVLSHPASIEACRAAGIPDNRIISGRGPFSVEENLAVMSRHNIGVIVTKDSGVAGGVPAKIEAAERHGCRVVVVGRPGQPGDQVFSDVGRLVEMVIARLGG